MALIPCPECSHKISDKAEKCPNCGFPMYLGIKCPECGEIIREGLDTCSECGYPLNLYDKSKSPRANNTNEMEEIGSICYPEEIPAYLDTHYWMNPFAVELFERGETFFDSERVENNRHRKGIVLTSNGRYSTIRWEDGEITTEDLVYEADNLHSLEVECFAKWDIGTILIGFANLKKYIVRDVFSDLVCIEDIENGSIIGVTSSADNSYIKAGFLWFEDISIVPQDVLSGERNLVSSLNILIKYDSLFSIEKEELYRKKRLIILGDDDCLKELEKYIKWDEERTIEREEHLGLRKPKNGEKQPKNEETYASSYGCLGICIFFIVITVLGITGNL